MGRRTNKQMLKDGRQKRGGGGPVRVSGIDPGLFASDFNRQENTRVARRAHALTSNEFVRQIGGFSSRASDLLLNGGFPHVTETHGGCIVPVHFSGISLKPNKVIDYRKPGIALTRGRAMVLSGVVSGPDQGEIGSNTSTIDQISAPNIDSHCSPSRLNVELGQSATVTHGELSAALRGSTLVISQVVEINGRPVLPRSSAMDIDMMWDRPTPPQPTYSSSSYGW
jgi:hypothetical protein